MKIYLEENIIEFIDSYFDIFDRPDKESTFLSWDKGDVAKTPLRASEMEINI